MFCVIITILKEKKRGKMKMLQEILTTMEQYFNEIKRTSSTSTRKRYGEKMIIIIRDNPQIKEYWEYKPKEFLWTNRFCQRKPSPYSTLIIKEGIIKDPVTDLLSAPSYGGLYLIGQTSFNPYTKEEQYWLKVGYSCDIWSRFKKGYATHCPCTALIDTTTKGNEIHCHEILRSLAIGRCQINTEWWLVDRETYLEICEKKFNYFFN
jgi:hypothetical protein